MSSNISKIIKDFPEWNYFVFRDVDGIPKDFELYLKTNFPTVNWLLVSSGKSGSSVNLIAKSNFSLEWVHYIFDVIKSEIDTSDTSFISYDDITRYTCKAQFPDKVADQAQLLGQEFMYVKGLRTRAEEEPVYGEDMVW